MDRVSLATIPIRTARAGELEIEDRLFVYSNAPGRGSTYSLEPSARRVWELCDGRNSVWDLGRALALRFDIALEDSLLCVREALHRLAGHGLVVLEGRAGRERRADWIEWSKVAEPQSDEYDTWVAVDSAAAHLMACRSGPGRVGARQENDGRASFVDGRVAIAPCYRDANASLLPPQLEDAVPDHPHIALAEEYLRRWPAAFEQFGRLMRCLHPLVDATLPDDESAFLRRSRSHSVEDRAMFGTMFSTVNCPLMLADNCVHEMAHQKLFALGVYKERSTALILNSPEDLYVSPVITDRARPMTAVVHGVYAFCYVSQLDLKILPMFTGERRRKVQGRLARNLARLAAGGLEVRNHVRPDGSGAAFLEGMYAWIDRMLAEGRAYPS